MSDWTQGPEAILAPTTLTEFMAKHWDDAPLVIRGRGEDVYAGLLSIEDLDSLIHQTSRALPTFRLVKDGAQIPVDQYTVDTVPWGIGAVSGFMDREAVRALMADGATYVMETVQRVCPTIGRLSRTFEQTFHCPSPANLYVTPPGAQGFQPHFDVQNVFVLQLHGTKHWRVYGPHVTRPLPSQAIDGAVTPGELLHDVTLEPGDLLYLPRGFVHVANTTDTLSAHISVSLLPNTWADVFKSLTDTLSQDVRFRATVSLQPEGPAEATDTQDEHFSALMAAFAQGSDLEDALDALGKRFVATRLPDTTGQLMALQDPQPVEHDTCLQRVPGIVWRVDADADQAHLHLQAKTISVPWPAIAALRWVANGAPFTPVEIPGDLSDARKCELAQYLLKEGFIHRV